MKYMIMFVVFMNIYTLQQVNACCDCIPPCPHDVCCHSGCCNSSSSLQITADDILNYINTGSHPDWEVIRKPETLRALASAAEITVGEVKNLGNGSYTVHYTVRGIPQKATIVPKKAPKPAAPAAK